MIIARAVIDVYGDVVKVPKITQLKEKPCWPTPACESLENQPERSLRHIMESTVIRLTASPELKVAFR